MNDIIKNNYEIEKISTTKDEAISIFKQNNMIEKAELLKYKEYDDVKIYKCNGYIDHFYGYMLPSTGYIKTFDLKLYKSGVILLDLVKKIRIFLGNLSHNQSYQIYIVNQKNGLN